MASPAATRIPVEIYLRTDYRPDREYVDGEIQERNLGERDHAGVQMALGRWFSRFRREWGIVVFAELRVQVSPTRFRVPDVCVLASDIPREQIITHPPMICIEVLSPEDTVRRTLERVADYRAMGVGNIWILDPAKRQGWECRPEGLILRERFAVADSPVYLDLPELFADVD